jgi:2-polyprenyl-3-methyl-5-hydroxy-6-metoxy-1,4-benzoquinol methylase
MGRKVAYRRQTIDTPNPVARYAHRQRYRLSLEQAADTVRDGGVVLDVGCGDGDFLNALAGLRPDLDLWGYDPESNHTPQHYGLVDDLASVSSRSVDLVCCFETLEHLYDREIDTFVDDATRMLAPGGRLLVSVPIIGGPPLLLKELNRVVLFRKGTDYSARELAAASVLGRPAPRPDNWRISHKGFDFRRLDDRLAAHFEPVHAAWSPFPRLPWWLNSQAFRLLRPST